MATGRQLTFNPKALLARIGDGHSIGEYRKEQVVFSQGEPADAVFLIQRGKVKDSVVSERGKEAVVAVLGRNEFVGEGCLAGQLLRISTATVMADAVILRLEKTAVLHLIREDPSFSELFIAHLLTRAVRVEADLVDELFNSSEKRLARTLLLLANFGQDGKPEPMIAKISQETLAQMVGTTRARVSYFMNKFRKLGFIAGAMRQDGQYRVRAHRLRPRHRDRHLDPHRVRGLADQLTDGQRMVPERNARTAALVLSPPRMSVPMPMSSTMRFQAIRAPSPPVGPAPCRPVGCPGPPILGDPGVPMPPPTALGWCRSPAPAATGRGILAGRR